MATHCQEVNALEPFFLGQLHVPGKGVQVLDQARHDFFEPSVRRFGEAGNDCLCDVVLVEVAHGLFAVGSVELR